MPSFNNPHDALRHHVSGAVERGESESIVEIPASFTTFKLELDGGNAEMQTLQHIAQALRNAANEIENSPYPYPSGTVRDANGNTIGEYRTL